MFAHWLYFIVRNFTCYEVPGRKGGPRMGRWDQSTLGVISVSPPFLNSVIIPGTATPLGTSIFNAYWRYIVFELAPTLDLLFCKFV